MSCSLCRNPTALGWVACLWSLGRLMVFGCLFTWLLIVWLFLVYHLACCSIGYLQLCLFTTLFACNFGLLHNRFWLSSASPSNCLLGLLSNRAQLCVTIFNCFWLCQGVVCWFCQAIVCNFGWLVGWLTPWPCLCKLFLTIGSLNCKRSKTKFIFK